MSRNNRKGIKKISIDLKYSSVFISKLINGLMLRGRKEIAQKIVYNSLFIISKTKKDIEINQFLERVIINISPIIEVKSRKVGGSIYQIPVSVIFKRQLALVIRFILCALRKRKEKQLEKRLACELLDAFFGVGLAVKNKHSFYKIAESNRAFAHLCW